MSRYLNVWINDKQVGTLSSQDDIWRFQYAGSWLSDTQSFPISPKFQLQSEAFIDGSDQRPVQWYFDNLLPEEQLRSVLSKEAGIAESDAFGLLGYYGAESAGSIVLDAEEPRAENGWKPLTPGDLSQRILNLLNATLGSTAPKRMSLAGAQHKMVVGFKDGHLFEPLAGTASTHILKPESTSEVYPHSVINEFFCMSLARAVGLSVPAVHLLYVPQPVYVVERFDRQVDSTGTVQRLHIIDTCQLLNRSRAFKYKNATVETLAEAVAMSNQRAADRLALFDWVLFNFLIGNGDNHLKNLSFLIDDTGVRLAPAYDLLSTAVYETRAFNDSSVWPNSQLAMSIAGKTQFDQIGRQEIVHSADVLGVPASIANRQIDAMLRKIIPTADEIISKVETQQRLDASVSNQEMAKLAWAGESRLLRAIRHNIFVQTTNQLK